MDPAATVATRFRLPVVVLRVNSEMVPELKLVANARVDGLAVPVGVDGLAVPVGVGELAVPVGVGVGVLVAVTVGKIEPPHATMPTVPARSSNGGKIAKILSAVESLDNNFSLSRLPPGRIRAVYKKLQSRAKLCRVKIIRIRG